MKDVVEYMDKGYAIQCKTREEFDFVISKYNPKALSHNLWDRNKERTCVWGSGRHNGCFGDWNETSAKKGYTLIQASEFMAKELVFEVGKWYKTKEGDNTYTKCANIDITRTRFDYNECILNGKYCNSYKQGTWFKHPEMTEATLEEIQQYLPEGHVDKILIEFDILKTSFGFWGQDFDRMANKTLKSSIRLKDKTNLTNLNQKENDTSKESCKVQRVNISISGATTRRGEGFTSPSSKVRFGDDHCDHQKRLS